MARAKTAVRQAVGKEQALCVVTVALVAVAFYLFVTGLPAQSTARVGAGTGLALAAVVLVRWSWIPMLRR
ncbi:MAG TPA: hypothetical protein VF572_00035 [Candidatus Saccharimonadales bacterium]|jgi:hypothetical protein